MYQIVLDMLFWGVIFFYTGHVAVRISRYSSGEGGLKCVTDIALDITEYLDVGF